MRDKVRMLENKLAELIQFGEENDGISEKLHALTLALLAARTPQDIVAALNSCICATALRCRTTRCGRGTCRATLCTGIGESGVRCRARPA
jgi:hypothetical protein